MSGWNFADIWEAATSRFPTAPFARQGKPPVDHQVEGGER